MKPVAYGMLTFCKNCGEQNPYAVKEQDESFDRTASHMAGEYVSYTKKLTDEEIDECLYSTDWSYDPHSFARAILRKAQEK